MLARGNTLRSGEDSLKLNELMELCTNLKTRVLDLEKTKTTQAKEIVSLKRRVKKLEQKKRSRTHGLKRLYKVGLTTRVESSRDEESLGEDASKQGRINAIDADEDITLVNDQDDTDMFNVNTLTALAALKNVKPKVKANVVEEPSVPVSAASTKVSAATTTTTAIIPTPRKGIVITELGISTTTTTISSQPSQVKVQDKGKGIMIEEPVVEQVKHMKRLEQMRLDEELAFKLQAEEKERLAREKVQQIEEANIAWDDVQAKVEVDYQLAQRLTELVEESSKKTKTKLEENLKKAKEKVMEGSSKRAGTELEQEVTKKQKVDDVQETSEVDNDQKAAKIKELMEIVLDKEEVAIDAIPLAVKPPSISSVICLKALTGKIWKLYGNWLKLSMGQQGQRRAMKECYRIYMLVEKKYHLTPATITDMLNKKLQLKLSMKKLDILKKNIKFRGGLLGLKDFMIILKLLLL
ncbi:hypothetical protein Tco_1295930, partial [Tanacetum coccineum]